MHYGVRNSFAEFVLMKNPNGKSADFVSHSSGPLKQAVVVNPTSFAGSDAIVKTTLSHY